MRVLHIFSDWKWTGPAEPVLNLCLGLQAKGHSVTLACYPPPGYYTDRNLLSQAREQGINTLTLIKTQHILSFLWNGLRNFRHLEDFLMHHPVDIIHSHSIRDHLMAIRALKPKPLCIWTNHQGTPLPRRRHIKYILEHHTDGYITLSPKLLSADQTLFHLPIEKSYYLEGAIDLGRFKPIPIRDELRTKLGLSKDNIIGGIVARMQRHRRFDVLLKAVKLVVGHLPQFRLIVIGRGTHRKEVAIEPAQRMGLTNHVIFIGYHTTDYLEVLAALDFGIFLVPGSDGSCRAVREMMAMGKPVIVAQRGILPEIVDDGSTGLVVGDEPGNLAQAILKLAKDRLLINKLGKNARAKAVKDFSLKRQVEKLEGFYHRLLIRLSKVSF